MGSLNGRAVVQVDELSCYLEDYLMRPPAVYAESGGKIRGLLLERGAACSGSPS